MYFGLSSFSNNVKIPFQITKDHMPVIYFPSRVIIEKDREIAFLIFYLYSDPKNFVQRQKNTS